MTKMSAQPGGGGMKQRACLEAAVLQLCGEGGKAQRVAHGRVYLKRLQSCQLARVQRLAGGFCAPHSVQAGHHLHHHGPVVVEGQPQLPQRAAGGGAGLRLCSDGF